MAMKGFNQVPPLNNRELFRRDRHVCASRSRFIPGNLLPLFESVT